MVNLIRTVDRSEAVFILFGFALIGFLLGVAL